MPGLTATTTPTESDCISQTDAKEYLSQDASFTLDDDLVDDMIVRAYRLVAERMDLPILNVSYQYTLDRWPAYRSDHWQHHREIKIPMWPLVSLTAVEYIAEGAASQTYTTISSGDYHTDAASEPPRVRFDEDFTVPTLDRYWLNAVRLSFTAGYGTAGASVPGPIRLAILRAIGHFFRFRDSRDRQSFDIPMEIDLLISPFARPSPGRTLMQ